MKLDMLKEYENMKYYLENIFLGERVSDNAEMREAWAEVQKLHLSNINSCLAMAKMLQANEFKTMAEALEAQEIIDDVYVTYMKSFPDEAFIEHGDAQ